MSVSPMTRRFQAYVPPMATAANDQSTTALRAPFAGVVQSVSYAPNAAITGQDTNTRAIRLRNRGQAGSGTTVIAELQFNRGVNAAAFDEKAITLSATPANLVVAEGDILEVFSDAVLTGIADPGGLLVVEIAQSYA